MRLGFGVADHADVVLGLAVEFGERLGVVRLERFIFDLAARFDDGGFEFG